MHLKKEEPCKCKWAGVQKAVSTEIAGRKIKRIDQKKKKKEEKDQGPVPLFSGVLGENSVSSGGWKTNSDTTHSKSSKEYKLI